MHSYMSIGQLDGLDGNMGADLSFEGLVHVPLLYLCIYSFLRNIDYVTHMH